MKKILDKYNIPGCERRVTYFAIKRSNTAENNIQLLADVDFIPPREKPTSVRTTKTEQRKKRKISSTENIQLTLEFN